MAFAPEGELLTPCSRSCLWCFRPWHAACEYKCVDVAGRHRIRAHKIESSANVTGALSLFASLKRGHRGRRHLALQKGTSKPLRHQTRDPGERIVAPGDAQTGERTRYWLWLDNTITGLWVAFLLAIIAYALVDGEGVLAQLDGLDLVAAYSLSP
jgi:hypothetical protein